MPRATNPAVSAKPKKATATKSNTSKSSTASKTTKSSSSYDANGVYISPSTFSVGDRIKITYSGLLANSGAAEVYAHIGFGASKWQDITDIKMTKTSKGFEATVPVSSTSTLNVAFKDNANNWDNNSGSNYCFKKK